MMFTVRSPIGHLVRVRLSNSLVIISILLATLHVVFGWASAYCTSHPVSMAGLCRSADFTANDQQAKTNVDRRDSLMAIINLIFVGVTALAAVLTYLVYKNIRDHTTQVERAYIDLSHHPPGMIDVLTAVTLSNSQDRSVAPVRNIRVSIAVKNHGNTPGNVVQRLIHEYISASGLPETPPYQLQKIRRTQIHLVKEAAFNIGGEFTILAADLDEITSAQAIVDPNTAKKLYVIGFVDYVDKFQRRHRSGYARVYVPAVDREKPIKLRRKLDGTVTTIDDEFAYARRNNLRFVAEPGYNYDIEIDEEGNAIT